MGKPQLRIFTLAVSLCIIGSIALAQTTTPTDTQASTASSKQSNKTPAATAGSNAETATPTAASSARKSPGKPAATDAQIAAAKSSGQVWVNTETGVYHKGGRWYGKTKNGKFMSQADAKAAGYKASHRD